MRTDDISGSRVSASGHAGERRLQQRAIDTRGKIVSAALAEFAVHGFEGTSTRTVAARAGVQHPLVNYHFKNKEGLWRAVLASTGGRFMEQFRQRLSGLRGVDEVTKLRLVQEDFIRFSAENPYFHLLMSQEARRASRQLGWLLREIVKPYFGELVLLIRAAQRAGRYIEGDPYHLQYLFIGAATRIFTLAAEVNVIAGRSPFSPRMIEDHITVCLALFFREPVAPPAASSGRPDRRPRRRTPKKEAS